MFLKKSWNQSGRIYLTIAQSYRIDGKARHKTVEKLGYLDELEKEYADPISHFKTVVAEKNKKSDTNTARKIEIELNSKLPEVAL